jgi:hypothetical protein
MENRNLNGVPLFTIQILKNLQIMLDSYAFLFVPLGVDLGG